MLLNVPGAKSSDGLPAIVTSPGLLGCLWGEYVRHYVLHINSIEGAWGPFKRQVYGIHHHVSPKHLGAYLSEMCYRYNRREMGEADRVNDLLDRVSGRLTYKALISDGTEVREATEA